MDIEPFKMERMQSNWEHVVECNLSESGVHPARIEDLLSEREVERLLKLELGYPQTNGSVELRRTIAAMYEGADESNVLVTTGTAEANCVASLLLTAPRDEVALMLPNYMQIWGLVRSQAARVHPFYLLEERRWAPDLEELKRNASDRTRLIAVCHPNNPTGAVLSRSEMLEIVDCARGVDAWLLSDEVYRGAELSGEQTPSFWGLYDKVIVTCGLSKAYGLPGLRVGWIVSTPGFVEKAWSYRDYITISVSATSDFLARRALHPERRSWLLARTRQLLNGNLQILREWVSSRSPQFSLVEPKAGAIAYLRYALDVPSEKLVDSLRTQQGVLLVPGAHFEMGNYLRIGYGCLPDQLRDGLQRIDHFLDSLD